MNSRASMLLALVLACVAAGAGTWAYREHQHFQDAAAAKQATEKDLALAQKRLDLAQADNTRLHDTVAKQQKEIDSAYEEEQRKAIEQEVVAIRGLNFDHPVEYETLNHADIKKILGGKLSEQYSDEDFKHFSGSLAAFGLVPPGFDLKDKYVSLLGEQVAAFYDQHHHKLYMFEDASLHDTQNRVVLAHELTHALQDQHFGLLLIPLEVKNNDDLALATSSLVEGDATLVMGDYEAKHISFKLFTDSISSALKQNMDQLQKAPRFLRETLVFPYTHGKDFCTALYESGGYQAISNAFKHPPMSSTQILHPEKYMDNEQPIRVEWPDLAVNGKKPTDDNVLGEFGTRILFEKYMDEDTAVASAEGWRGDRYIVYDDSKGMVWKTLWQDADHQSAFRDALLRYIAKRFKQSTTTQDGDNIVFSAPAIPAAPASDGHAATAGSPGCTGEIITTKTGNGIILIWGETKELNDSLLEKFKE